MFSANIGKIYGIAKLQGYLSQKKAGNPCFRG
jgi:hypothetical protein